MPPSIGSTNPIWLDADGDGQFTCARAYARRLVSRYGAKPSQILPALNEYDEAVAAAIRLGHAVFVSPRDRSVGVVVSGQANLVDDTQPDRIRDLLRTLEDKETLKRRIDEASKFVPLEQLCLSPQCGFSSTVDGNALSYDEQVAKLRLIVETAQEVWG